MPKCNNRPIRNQICNSVSYLDQISWPVHRLYNYTSLKVGLHFPRADCLLQLIGTVPPQRQTAHKEHAAPEPAAVLLSQHLIATQRIYMETLSLSFSGPNKTISMAPFQVCRGSESGSDTLSFYMLMIWLAVKITLAQAHGTENPPETQFD